MGLLSERLGGEDTSKKESAPKSKEKKPKEKKKKTKEKAPSEYVEDRFDEEEVPLFEMRPEEYEKILEEDELASIRREAKKDIQHKKMMRLITVILITACVYLMFLIYGVFCTQYVYDDSGKIVPVTLTVNEIRKKTQFDKLKVQYEDCRVLYEKVLLLDYRLAQGVEDPLTLAPEYEALLDDVNNLTIKTDALDVETKYETIKRFLVTWVKNDTAIYLQKISSGISGNNSADADIAIQYKTIMYDDFSLITQNIITIGEEIKGTDMTSVKNWSPDRFINATIYGGTDE